MKNSISLLTFTNSAGQQIICHPDKIGYFANKKDSVSNCGVWIEGIYHAIDKDKIEQIIEDWKHCLWDNSLR